MKIQQFSKLKLLLLSIEPSIINKGFTHERHTCTQCSDTKRSMDTSEAELGIISSETDPDVVTSGDTIYQGINFSALKRELAIQKLW